MKATSFRLTETDLNIIKEIRAKYRLDSDIDVVRFALRSTVGLSPSSIESPQMPNISPPRIQWTKPKRELGAVDILSDDGEVQVVMDPDAEGYVNPIYKPPKQNNG